MRRPDDIRPTVLILADSMVAGGLERQVVELLRGLRSSGRFRTAFGVLDHGGQREAEAVALAELSAPIARRWRYDGSSLVSLGGWAKRTGIDLIHSYGWMCSGAGTVAARRLGIPILNGCIRNAPPALDWRDHLSARLMRGADAIVANSEAGLRAFGLAGHPRSLVIRNGVDLRRFMGVTPAASAGAGICMVGNFTANKDQAALLRAMPAVLAVEPAARLTLVGRGGTHLTACRRLAAELRIDACTEFVTDTNDPEPWVAASRVCVLASNARVHGEGISNAIIEYMALGKPVVANDCGGNREIVVEGETGFVVVDSTPAALAGPIVRLLRDPALATRMGAAGRGRVLREYGVERMVDEYEALYERLLAGRAGGH